MKLITSCHYVDGRCRERGTSIASIHVKLIGGGVGGKSWHATWETQYT